jgi:hypothetical protein
MKISSRVGKVLFLPTEIERWWATKRRCPPYENYFGTDTKTLAQFSPAMSSVFGNPKPEIFCGTLPQSDEMLSTGINFQAKVSRSETFA